jgi:hypothetical protein
MLSHIFTTRYGTAGQIHTDSEYSLVQVRNFSTAQHIQTNINYIQIHHAVPHSSGATPANKQAPKRGCGHSDKYAPGNSRKRNVRSKSS